MLNKEKLNNFANEIWKSAERLRGKFKAYEYQSVVMPFIVLRRIECVLIDWREEQKRLIKAKRPKIEDDKLDKLVKQLELKDFHISNKTNWTMRKIYEEDLSLVDDNFREYINGFSENIEDIIDHFDFRATIGKLIKNKRLIPMIHQYSKEDIGPDKLSNLEMGHIYEELLRRFSEQSGEEAGEHFTPREVIRIMVELLDIKVDKKHISVYDPACGTGGMLSVAKEHLLDHLSDEKERRRVDGLVTLHGHEIQPGNYAICKSDMLIKDDQHAHIFMGNSLIPDDKHSKEPGDQLGSSKDKFDYMLSNPPFGVTWGGKDGYQDEVEKYSSSRYKAGLPRVNDGAFLFLQTMLAKMKPESEGGSRIAIVFNGSPLSNGDCGSGESEIRRWIIEKDWLDAIIMLPDQMFYNTGIFTYIWVLTNNKPKSHKGKVKLIDARKQSEREPKSFGKKRNRIADSHRKAIVKCYKGKWDDGFKSEDVMIFKNKDFAFHKVKVIFWQTDEKGKKAYITEKYDKALSSGNIKKEQEFYNSDIDFNVFATVADNSKNISFTLKPEDSFTEVYQAELQEAFSEELNVLTEGAKDAKGLNKIIKAFVRDIDVDVEFTHRHYVKDDEYITYADDIEDFLNREINKEIIYWKDSPQLGYEILPSKYFYKYEPLKSADKLLEEFWKLEVEADEILKGLGG